MQIRFKKHCCYFPVQIPRLRFCTVVLPLTSLRCGLRRYQTRNGILSKGHRHYCSLLWVWPMQLSTWEELLLFLGTYAGNLRNDHLLSTGTISHRDSCSAQVSVLTGLISSLSTYNGEFVTWIGSSCIHFLIYCGLIKVHFELSTSIVFFYAWCQDCILRHRSAHVWFVRISVDMCYITKCYLLNTCMCMFCRLCFNTFDVQFWWSWCVEVS